jgi:hypothetical protein
MKNFEMIPPTDEEIFKAEKKLGFTFSNEYVQFLKSGYDLADIPMEALEIVNPPSYANIYTALDDARKFLRIPHNLLPICEDNSDYYCLSESGEVIFYSHNGATDDKWENVSIWRNQMIAENSE